MAYTEVQKALAVELIRRNNNVLDDLTLAEIRRLLHAPALSDRGVRNWLKNADAKKFTDKKDAVENPPAVTKSVEQTIEETAATALDQMFEETARKYLTHAQTEKIIGETKGKDAVIAAATAFDKMRIARGLPTEIIQLMPGLLDAINNVGLNPADVFKAMIEELGQKRQEASRVDGD